MSAEADYYRAVATAEQAVKDLQQTQALVIEVAKQLIQVATFSRNEIDKAIELLGSDDLVPATLELATLRTKLDKLVAANSPLLAKLETTATRFASNAAKLDSAESKPDQGAPPK